MLDRKTVDEMVKAKYKDGCPDADDVVNFIMQLLTSHRMETYKHILEHGLNDTFTHPEWIAILERGADIQERVS